MIIVKFLLPYLILTPIMYVISRKSKNLFKKYMLIATIFFSHPITI